MRKLMTAILLLGMSNGLMAAEAENVMVMDAYVRGLPPTAENTSAYMRLMNHGNEALELTGASSPAAASVSLHETVNEGGMMNMRHVDSARIPVHGELALVAGGLHMMLMDLHAPLAEGDSVEIVLEFANGTTRTLNLPVRSVMSERSGGGHDNH